MKKYFIETKTTCRSLLLLAAFPHYLLVVYLTPVASALTGVNISIISEDLSSRNESYFILLLYFTVTELILHFETVRSNHQKTPPPQSDVNLKTGLSVDDYRFP